MAVDTYRRKWVRGGATPHLQDAANRLAAIAAAAFAVRPHELHDVTRGSKKAAFARQVAIYLSHTSLGLSYTSAGALFGRDRTTAAYACRVVEDKREDARIDAIVNCLERALDRWPNVGGGAAP